MINTDKNVSGIPENNGENNRTTEEMIGKIIERTGVTKEQAKEALDKHNGDLLDAMIYVERTYGQASKAAQQTTKQTAQSAYTVPPQSAAPQYGSPQTNYCGQNTQQPDPSQPSAEFVGTVKKVTDFLLGNQLVINSGGKEIASIPVLFCVIAFIVSFNALLIIMLASLFFGVSYQFRGPQLGKARVNFALDALYGVAQNIKASLS